MILFAFAVFSLAYFYTGFMGKMSFIPETVQGLILTVVAALPMAIFGILPQAVVADIARVIPSHPEATGKECFMRQEPLHSNWARVFPC